MKSFWQSYSRREDQEGQGKGVQQEQVVGEQVVGKEESKRQSSGTAGVGGSKVGGKGVIDCMERVFDGVKAIDIPQETVLHR